MTENMKILAQISRKSLILLDKILHQLICWISHYLQGSVHVGWCRISSSDGMFIENHSTYSDSMIAWWFAFVGETGETDPKVISLFRIPKYVTNIHHQLTIDREVKETNRRNQFASQVANGTVVIRFFVDASMSCCNLLDLGQLIIDVSKGFKIHCKYINTCTRSCYIAQKDSVLDSGEHTICLIILCSSIVQR